MKPLSFYHIFSSHMVLQRERPIVFCGTGEPYATLSITFAAQTKEAVIEPDGKWSATFPFMNAGGPYTLTAGYKNEAATIAFDDILIGEVWMCTGQSNMEMPMYSENRFWRTLNAEEELKHADYPTIRLFNSFATRRLAPEAPLEDENPDNAGWVLCNADTVANFSACGYFFGRQLSRDLNVPIGLINTAWGGTNIEAWISDRKFTEYNWQLVKHPDVKNENDCTSPACCNYPSTLTNALLHPWFNYAIRGTIWYQGCNNNGQFTYYPLHQMLIEDLRESWNDPDMPFLLVQLAAFHQHTPENPLPSESIDDLPVPEFSPYGITREIQAELPHIMDNVGMVTAFDCGDPCDIHPRDKQTVGYRLALKAEDMLHWIKRDCDGPEYAGYAIEGNKIRVFFDNAATGLTTIDGKPPRAFVLGTRDGRLIKANAAIDGSTVVVSSPQVSDPQRVRYAFTGYCLVNLINKEGFPAIPFRSDKPDYSQMF